MRATLLPVAALAAPLAALTLVIAPVVDSTAAAAPAQESAPDAGPAGSAERLPELSDATLDRLLTAIGPTEDEEAWRRLPWRTTFWQGVIDAQEADKPVLLFAMNGHPFGCT